MINKNIKLNYTVTMLLLIIFIFMCIFFPEDFYGLKKISFILIILLNAKRMIVIPKLYLSGLIIFFGIIFPVFLICIGYFLDNNLLNIVSRTFPFFIINIVFIIHAYNIDFKKILIYLLNMEAIFILAIVISDIVGFINVNDNSTLRNFIYENGIGFIGKSQDYPLYYKIFLKTSPLLVIPLFEHIYNKKIIMSIVIFLALLFTGTRANLLFTLIMLLLYYFIHNKSKANLLSYVSRNIVIILIFLVFIIFIGTFIDIFIIKGLDSDIVRLGHIKGLIELIKDKPLSLFLGTGLGSEFYSYSVGMTSSIEIPYLDLIRQIGLVGFFIYMIFISYPILNRKNNIYKNYAYITYLLIAGTNPLLLNSTAYLMYIYIYYDLYKDNKFIHKGMEL